MIKAELAIHAEVLEAHEQGTGVRPRDLIQSAGAARQMTLMGVPLIVEPNECAGNGCLRLPMTSGIGDGEEHAVGPGSREGPAIVLAVRLQLVEAVGSETAVAGLVECGRAG